MVLSDKKLIIKKNLYQNIEQIYVKLVAQQNSDAQIAFTLLQSDNTQK